MKQELARYFDGSLNENRKFIIFLNRFYCSIDSIRLKTQKNWKKFILYEEKETNPKKSKLAYECLSLNITVSFIGSNVSICQISGS